MFRRSLTSRGRKINKILRFGDHESVDGSVTWEWACVGVGDVGVGDMGDAGMLGQADESKHTRNSIETCYINGYYRN